MQKLMKTYKKHKIVKNNGVYEVIHPDKSRFIVALDDSKSSGKRSFVNKANNLKTAMNYIDLVTK